MGDFLLFSYTDYYARGGINDYIGGINSFQKAMQIIFRIVEINNTSIKKYFKDENIYNNLNTKYQLDMINDVNNDVNVDIMDIAHYKKLINPHDILPSLTQYINKYTGENFQIFAPLKNMIFQITLLA